MTTHHLLRALVFSPYLPNCASASSNLTADVQAAEAWQRFPAVLEDVVRALDHGRTLADLHVLFTAKRINSRIALAGEQLAAIDVLAKMEVKGAVRLQYRYDFREIKSGLVGLDLEKRMRAQGSR